MKDQGQGVFLPYREFLEMWNQLTAQRETAPEPPPTESLLTSAEYSGRVDGEVAVMDAVLRVESFKDGWSVLPLGGPGLNIAKAETGDATLRLGEKGPEVILPKKGRYELKLQVLAKVQRSTGRFAVTLRPPRTAVSKLELSIPEQGWEFTSKPAAAFTAQPAADGRTRFAVFFGETDEMEIAWQKAGEESKLTPLVHAGIPLPGRGGAGPARVSRQEAPSERRSADPDRDPRAVGRPPLVVGLRHPVFGRRFVRAVGPQGRGGGSADLNSRFRATACRFDCTGSTDPPPLT